MNRSRLAEATLIGCLTALAIFCAGRAHGGETYSIVAQSNRATAATGRRPLAERISAANLPIIAQSTSSRVPAAIEPTEAAHPEAHAATARTGNGENMAVAAVRVDQPEASVPPPRPAATPPVLWPFGTKRSAPARPETTAKRPVAPAGQNVAKARPNPAAGRDGTRQANAKSSGNGLSSSSPASVTR